ncbi:hypothetical protein ACWCOP_13890 [Maricaulaceae bacterium MS644]
MTRAPGIGMLGTLKATIRSTPLYAPVWRRNYRRNVFEDFGGPGWDKLLEPHLDEWRRVRSGASGPRVLVATSIGAMHAIGLVDSLIAVALTRRGAQVEFLLCDGILPACQIVDHGNVPSRGRFLRKGPQPDFCGPCTARGNSRLAPLGLPVRHLSDWVLDDERSRAAAEARLGAPDPSGVDPLSTHALAGALRFEGLSSPPGTAEFTGLYRRYLEAAWLASMASEALFREKRYDFVLAHHGVYVPQGLIAEAARTCGAQLATWHPSYRSRSILMQHGDTYHRAMISEPEARWNRRLSADEDAALTQYLESRERPDQGWVTYQREAAQGAAAVIQDLELDPSRPIDVLISNVSWDARLHYEDSAYTQMADWAADTVAWYCDHPERQLVVRCHPGEVMNQPRSREMLHTAIQSCFGALPENVRVVSANDGMNTYDLARAAERVMVYATKMAVELAAWGLPVIVGGEAWVRGKGFSFDAGSPDEYLAFLADPATCRRLDAASTERARRYAYHFFFRRCMPIAALTEPEDRDPTLKAWEQVRLSDQAFELTEPGADAGLDAVCEGVLSGTAFEYEAGLPRRGAANGDG